MNLDEQFAGLGLELFALAPHNFTAIASQALAKSNNNLVSVICSAFLPPAFGRFISWSVPILRQQPIKRLFGKSFLLVRNEQLRHVFHDA